MGQKLQTQAKLKQKYEPQFDLKVDSSANSNIQLLTFSSGEDKRQLFSLKSQSIEIFQRNLQSPEMSKENLQRQEKLLEFIGEVIYYCKMHMKKQRKYHYKISALLFYKYFFDKFRQLLSKYWLLYQQKIIFREEYQKKVTLVYQIKDTFVKIKKFVYGKIPFLSEKTKSYLNEESDEYCFNKKQFFTDLLYPQVEDILKQYNDNTNGQYNLPGINQCYLRMIKSIFIIEEFEFKNLVIMPQFSEIYPNYDIEFIQNWQDDKVKLDLKKNYEIFLKIKRS